MRKVTFRSVQRVTKATEGIYAIGMNYFDPNGKITKQVDLGKVLLSKKDGKYYGYRSGEIQGHADVVGETLSQAGEGLRKLYDQDHQDEANELTIQEPEPATPRRRGRPRKSATASASNPRSNTVPLEVAAQRICGTLANPMAGLKRRIAAGKVKTVTVDGETRVVM